MGPCTPSACMGPTCSRGPFRHDEDLPKYFKIGDSGRIRPFCRIQSPVRARARSSRYQLLQQVLQDFFFLIFF